MGSFKKKQYLEAIDILNAMLDSLMLGLPSKGEAGSDLRRVVGELRADGGDNIEDGVIGTELLACFEQARTAGAGLADFDRVRIAMLAEQPVYFLGSAIKLSGIVFSFA